MGGGEGGIDGAALSFTSIKLEDLGDDPGTEARLYGNSAVLDLAQRNLEAAIIATKRAIAIDPNEALFPINLTSYLLQKGEINFAFETILAAKDRWPDNWQIYQNLAIAYYCVGNLRHSLECFEYANKLLSKPSDEFLCDWGFVEIHAGLWDQGFKRLESRWSLPEKVNSFSGMLDPKWKGEDLHGKKVLVYQDQGDGDFFQFARFIPLLKQMGAEVTIAPLTGSCPLISRQNMGEVISFNFFAELPRVDFDFYIPIGAIPAIIPITPEEAWKEPYITVQNWQSVNDKFMKLPKLKRKALKVGICWHGNKQHQPWRAMPAEIMMTLAEDPRIQLYSLQCSTEAKTFGYDTFCFDLAPQINHWLDTAQFIDLMDVIVTVDTAMLHLAGAMGKYVIGCHAWRPDWRWPSAGSAYPWYGPKMALVRQDRPGDWQSVIKKVKTLL